MKKILKWIFILTFAPFIITYWVVTKSGWTTWFKLTFLTIFWISFLILSQFAEDPENQQLVSDTPISSPTPLVIENNQNNDSKVEEEIIEEVKTNDLEDSKIDDSIMRDNLNSDLEELRKMYSDLQENYKLAKNNGDYEFDFIWITNWNRHLDEIKDRYADYTFNRNDKYGNAKAGLSETADYLDILWKEYELSLQGKENDFETFEQFIEQGITMAYENISE